MKTHFLKPISLLAVPAAIITVATLAMASLRTSVDLAKVDFKSECASVSDPSDIALFFHEDIVNSFLSVNDKFGRGRMAIMPYQHAHFALHGGTTEVPGNWKDDATEYQLADWGLVGGIEDGEGLRVYYLKRQGARLAQAKDQDAKPQAELNDRDADAFETYAVAELKKGDKLVKWERPDFVRFVGSIRAAASCLRCHSEAKEGDVLGAFAYDFTKVAAPKAGATAPVIAAAREGKSMKKLVALLKKSNRYASEYQVRYLLAGAGVVTPEMIETQRQTRDWVLKEATQLQRRQTSVPRTTDLLKKISVLPKSSF